MLENICLVQNIWTTAKDASVSALAALSLLIGPQVLPAEAVLNSPNAGIARYDCHLSAFREH